MLAWHVLEMDGKPKTANWVATTAFGAGDIAVLAATDGGDKGELWYSIDGGSSWKTPRTSSGDKILGTSSNNWTYTAVYGAGSSAVIAGCIDNVVWFSVNGGSTWEKFEVPNASWGGLAVYGTTIATCDSNGKMWYTTNKGENWGSVNTSDTVPLNWTSVAVYKNVIAGTNYGTGEPAYKGKIWYSIDNGYTWKCAEQGGKPLSGSWGPVAVYVNDSSDFTIVACKDADIWYSNDGVNWKLSKQLPNVFWNSISIDDKTIVVGYESTTSSVLSPLLISVNGGESWINAPIEAITWQSVSVYGNTIAACSAMSTGRLWVSTDKGKTFESNSGTGSWMWVSAYKNTIIGCLENGKLVYYTAPYNIIYPDVVAPIKKTNYLLLTGLVGLVVLVILAVVILYFYLRKRKNN